MSQWNLVFVTLLCSVRVVFLSSLCSVDVERSFHTIFCGKWAGNSSWLRLWNAQACTLQWSCGIVKWWDPQAVCCPVLAVGRKQQLLLMLLVIMMEDDSIPCRIQDPRETIWSKSACAWWNCLAWAAALPTTSCDLLCSNEAVLGDHAVWEGEMISKIHSLHPAFQICTMTQVTCRLDWEVALLSMARGISVFKWESITSLRCPPQISRHFLQGCGGYFFNDFPWLYIASGSHPRKMNQVYSHMGFN